MSEQSTLPLQKVLKLQKTVQGQNSEKKILIKKQIPEIFREKN